MRSKLAALGAGLLLAGGLTACNDESSEVESDPSGSLSEAVRGLEDYEGVELTLAFDGDQEAIEASLEDPDAARLLLDSQISIRARGESEDDTQVEMVVDLDGNDAVEVRVLPPQRLFFRVDVEAISEVVDDPEFDQGVQEVREGAAQFGFGDLADDVAAGNWIELTGLEQLEEMLGAQGEEEPSEEEIEDLQQRIVGALERFLDEDVEVSYVGSEDNGERVRATTDGASVNELLSEITEIAGEAGGVDAGQLQGLDQEEIPSDEQVVLDAWIDDGVLAQVGFDLSTIEEADGDGAPEGTYILLGIAEFTGTIEAPDEATEFDLFGLVGGFMGGMGAEPGMEPGVEPDGDPGAEPGTEPDVDGDLDDEPVDGGDPEADPGEDPAAAECVEQEEIDAVVEQGGDEAQAEIDEAIEAGMIEVC
jgi:hypothetical protein